MAGGMLVRQPEEREPPVVESDSRKVELAEGEGKGKGEGMFPIGKGDVGGRTKPGG